MRTRTLVGALFMFAVVPLAQAATGDPDMIGTWKYSQEKHGRDRAMLGSIAKIEQAGALWTITLSYGPRVIGIYKCTGDGSACTTEEDKRQDLACKATWEGKKLLLDCTWVNGMKQKVNNPWVFLIQDGMLTISGNVRLQWFEKQ